MILSAIIIYIGLYWVSSSLDKICKELREMRERKKS